MNQIKHTFAAYLDEYHKVTVIVPNSYYDSKITPLIIEDSQSNEQIELKVEECHPLGDNTKYVLSLLGFIEMGKTYYVKDCFDERVLLTLGYITRTEQFDKAFYYNQSDLGATYSKDETTFKVWAPSATDVDLYLKSDGKYGIYKMTRQTRGVFSVTVKGDLELYMYRYHVTNNLQKREAIDPYAIASSINGEYSVVVDLNKTIKMKHPNPTLKQATDAIIYELSVRDFTISDHSNINHKGKYLGLIERPTLNTSTLRGGLDYILDLGVTHIQLMPVFDFFGVDERDVLKEYNWGYNPVQYNVPEGSYSQNPDHPYERINELKIMIDTFHKEGIGVIMDVVYNHVYSRQTHPFDALVPTYYYRYDYQGMPVNATGCGNDLATERLMVRSYILNSIRYWMTEFKIDGFRMDLMGIIDVDTMNEIQRMAHEINPNVLIYGEGWDMPTSLSQYQKAAKFNAKYMPHIGHFNDDFRDIIKGHTFNHTERGLALGNLNYFDVAKQVLAGSSGLYDGEGGTFFSPKQSVNYVECHDNHTFYDRALLSNSDESEYVRKKRQLLALAMVIFSQGIPFIHSGQEFYRTKKGVENSYDCSDEINQFDWKRAIEHEKTIEVVRDYIKLRKSHGAFRFSTSSLVKKHLKIFNHHHCVIEYNLSHVLAYGDYDEIKVLYNVLTESFEISLNESGYLKIADDEAVYLSQPQAVQEKIVIKPLSFIILAK